MKVTVTGSTGLIGTALVSALRRDGHEVVRLVRREPSAPDEARWDPHGTIDTKALEGTDAVVHLAGAGVGDRPWTSAYKRKIRESRVRGTRTLAQAIAGLESRPRVLISGSAIGFYGDTGGEDVDETAPMGGGFLAEVVRDWEEATAPAAEAGVRVVHSRTANVIAREGGLVGRMLPLFKLGLGAKLGDGRQWISWISLPDQIAALRHLIETDVQGPVNLAAPHPVTNAEFTKALARTVRRPAVLTVPRFALRMALREFADEGALISQRVMPIRLRESGFSFAHTDLDVALAALFKSQETPK